MFKTITTIFAALLMAIPANAQTKSDPQFCVNIEDIARAVMEARQQNVSMSRVMQILREALPEGGELAERLVTQAYEKPAYSTAEYQQREISDFANYWAARCYEMQRKKR